MDDSVFFLINLKYVLMKQYVIKDLISYKSLYIRLNIITVNPNLISKTTF